ncbi:Thioredoxin-related protein [Hartmannibacter diazotrophicus]|uniref:Thioredoxin-related protein n=1 Tax=Hartmannibacter diazotrophicus TaxID=1482074 RepID=A0A2C9DAX1_9HYPH|nr:thioredoxin family protein [Hartmannibacter diazotrophicus]SON57437.1 Thioredoxin-related protein [Hartmannibacter diazotrophicus]
MRTTLRILGLLLLGSLWAAQARSAELVLLVQPGCPWCAKFETEIAPAWPNTPEGKQVPLRRVDITKDWPADLAAIGRDKFTPTFVLVDGNREIARLRGYPGDQFFWYLVDDMLAKLPAQDSSGVTLERAG